MAVNPELIIRISGNSAKFQKELDKVQRQADIANGKISREAVAKQQITEKTLVASYKRIAVAAAAIVGGGVLAFNQFTKYEDALIGVQKTTDIAGQELEQFKTNIKGLSKELAQSQADLLGIAEAAGQLGVRGAENLTKFTRTIAMMNVASKTLQGEAAATALSKILTITGDGFENVDRFASVILRLGDNFATTEAQIAEMTLNIVQAGGAFKTSATDAAALAAAFSQLGINPEIARSTLVKFGVSMETVLRKGGQEMQALMEITGMTEAQLRKTFKEAPVEVFQAFSKGLNEVIKNGGSAAQVLDIFGLNTERALPLLTTAARGSEELARSLGLGRQEYSDNTKAQEEFAKRSEAASFKIEQLKVDVQNLATGLGEDLIPVFEVVLAVLKESANGVKILIDWLKDLGSWLDRSANKIGDWREKFRSAIGLETDEADGKAMIRRAQQRAEEERQLLAEHLGKQSEMKQEARAADQEAEIQQNAEHKSALAERMAQDEEEERQKEQDKRDAKLEREQAQFEEDMELLKERLEMAGILKDEAAVREIGGEIHVLKEKAKMRGLEVKEDIQLAKKKRDIEQQLVDQKVGLGLELLRAAGVNSKAIFLIEKAAAIAKSIVATNVAFVEALAHPPGPPTTIPIAAAVKTSGYLSTATIAATAITGFSSAQQGGTVPGGFGGGDRVPMLLEPGERILPKALSPTFEQMLREDRGYSNGGGGAFEIVLSGDAARLFTLKQRENSTLGIQR